MSLADIKRLENRVVSVEMENRMLRETVAELREALQALERRFVEMQREYMEAHQNPVFEYDGVASEDSGDAGDVVLPSAGIIGRGR
jgi:predicted nuclease with TOPRIM domain